MPHYLTERLQPCLNQDIAASHGQEILMILPISRRRFFGQSFGITTGAVLTRSLGLKAGSLGGRRARSVGSTPMIITSHTNPTGIAALEAVWGELAGGGSALDAVEKATNVIELDPEDMSVGYGGLPNEAGVVQLDASVMDGRTYNAGAVAGIENIKHPSSVARLVMERTDHVILVAEGAKDFALSFGFPEEELMTEKSRRAWLRWREERSDKDDWGPPDHLQGWDDGQGRGVPEGGGDREAFLRGPERSTHGTVNVLAVDARGDIAGITSTSGMSWKVPGRIGDSPIIGAGLYVDNEVGAAGATGRGEDVIKACSSFYIVSRMREGRSPQEACEDALRQIDERYAAVGIDYRPGEKFVAINKDGEFGCAWNIGDGPPAMSVMDTAGYRRYEGRNTTL
jgi:N4-(beta-N-acetylglucosaminyl)-L-asparaginase